MGKPPPSDRWSTLWKAISSGVVAVGILLSAAAVINTLSRALDVPLSHWLEAIIGSYRNLFFPIIDATIGKIPRIFNLHLTDLGKDLLLIYSVIVAAMMRTVRREDPTPGIISIQEIITVVLFTPFIIIITLADLVRGKDEMDPKSYIILGQEVLVVLLIVGTAMLLNSAGVLQ